MDGEVHWHYVLRLRGLTLAAHAPNARAPWRVRHRLGRHRRQRGPHRAARVDRRRPSGHADRAADRLPTGQLRDARRLPRHLVVHARVDRRGRESATTSTAPAISTCSPPRGIELADHRARSARRAAAPAAAAARSISAHVEAFRLVTATPLRSAGGPMRHRDSLPGALQQPLRVSHPRRRRGRQPGAVATGGRATCVVVDLPGVPPAPPAGPTRRFPPPAASCCAGCPTRRRRCAATGCIERRRRRRRRTSAR